MPISEQFIQNMVVIILIGIIAVCLDQPLALFGILLLVHLPQIQYIEEERPQAVGQYAELDDDDDGYSGNGMGFLAELKEKD